MQGTQAPEAFLGLGIFLAVIIALAISVAIAVVICLIIYKSFSALPQEHRKLEPGLVWLLLIPCFNVIWNFIVFLKLSDSYCAYFESVGRGEEMGDCGRGIFLAYCICTAVTAVAFWIPCVASIISLASLVLLILSLVKAHGLRMSIGGGEMSTPI
jgi:hypothetical protein